MVKTPKTRHSKPQKEPVTIDLEPDAVSRVSEPDVSGTEKSAEESASVFEAAEPVVRAAQPEPVTESATAQPAPAHETTGEAAASADPLAVRRGWPESHPGFRQPAVP